MEAVSAIAKVVQAIVKAATTDRENSKRCLALADRAHTVGHIIDHLESSTASKRSSGSGTRCTMIMREPPLKSLKAALEEALELVESQQPGGFGSGVKKLITSGTAAAKFQSVEARITACVTDLGLAEQFAARYRALHANTGAGSTPSIAPQPQKKSSLFTRPPTQQPSAAKKSSLFTQQPSEPPSLFLTPSQHNQSF